jgi:hypothetical protein
VCQVKGLHSCYFVGIITGFASKKWLFCCTIQETTSQVKESAAHSISSLTSGIEILRNPGSTMNLSIAD